MVYYISAILHEGDSYIIGCRDKPSVFVLNKTTRTIIQIDYSFRQSIYDIFSFGKNMVATVSAMKDYKDCINIFQINESTPHIHLFSFPSNLGRLRFQVHEHRRVLKLARVFEAVALGVAFGGAERFVELGIPVKRAAVGSQPQVYWK